MNLEVIIAILAITFALSLFSLIKIFNLKKEIKKIKAGHKEIYDLSDLTKLIKEISSEINTLKENSLQKIGIKRYNPFSDSGPDQSFTISLLDGKNNGIVLTSLHLNESFRVYAKPIKNGKSNYQLSKEELESLNELISNGKERE